MDSFSQLKKPKVSIKEKSKKSGKFPHASPQTVIAQQILLLVFTSSKYTKKTRKYKIIHNKFLNHILTIRNPFKYSSAISSISYLIRTNVLPS